MRSLLSLGLVATAAGFGGIPTLRAAVQPYPAAPATAAVDGPLLSNRRAALLQAAALLAIGSPVVASASGGATAGKYTTIPIAKRRYFGRVKQAVFEFISLGEEIKKGDLKGARITDFFADNIKVQSSRQKRQCLSANAAECAVDEKFSSRWEDMKLTMFLLGNAFRMDSGKPPEKVKQVKEAKAFTKQVESLRKASLAGDRKGAALSYAAAIEALDIYLNDVELPPTYSNEYSANADTAVPSLCQGSFCI